MRLALVDPPNGWRGVLTDVAAAAIYFAIPALCLFGVAAWLALHHSPPLFVIVPVVAGIALVVEAFSEWSRGGDGLPSERDRTPAKRRLAWLAIIGGWTWCLFAGGGGLGLLVLRGPWPPTNGWFALLSGLAACPLTGRLLRNSARLKVSGWHQFGAAAFLLALGRIALSVWPQPHPL
jgi:hypothetical protein